MTNANTPVYAIMKARYYAKTEFNDAIVGSNPSYMWRGIMEAHEVIKRGSKRKIRDGQDTKVWGRPWLPCEDNGYVTSEAYECDSA